MSAVAGYLASRGAGAAGTRALQLEGFLHGYRVAFVAGGSLFALALLAIIFLVGTKKHHASVGQDAVPAQALTKGRDR